MRLVGLLLLTLTINQQKAAPKISDAFAKAALIALHGVESELPEGWASAPPSKTSPEEKIDLAHSEAKSKSEESVLSQIRLLLIKRKILNLKRHGDEARADSLG